MPQKIPESPLSYWAIIRLRVFRQIKKEIDYFKFSLHKIVWIRKFVK